MANIDLERWYQPPTHYILDGQRPIACGDLTEWARRYKEDNRIVATNTADGVTVTTVFLGIDHKFSSPASADPPILFETLVFRGTEGEQTWDEQVQGHYATWDEAVAGHAKVLGHVTSKHAPAAKVDHAKAEQDAADDRKAFAKVKADEDEAKRSSRR